MAPKKDDHAPATKADMAYMLQTIMTAFGDAEKRVGTIEERMETVEERLGTVEERLGTVEEKIDSVLVQFEELRHDVLGALKDVRSNDRQVDDHEQRIRRIEAKIAA